MAAWRCGYCGWTWASVDRKPCPMCASTEIIDLTSQGDEEREAAL